MNKKNIIILSFAIIFLIVAIVIYFYANSLRTKENNTNSVSQTIHNDKKEDTKQRFYFYDINGEKFNLDDFSGKPTILMFWKSDIPDSYDMITLLETYYEENKDLVNFLAINVKEPDLEIIENVKAVDFKIPMYFDTDSTVENQYSFDSLPHIIFIEKDGTIGKEFDTSITEDEFTANLDLLEEKY